MCYLKRRAWPRPLDQWGHTQPYHQPAPPQRRERHRHCPLGVHFPTTWAPLSSAPGAKYLKHSIFIWEQFSCPLREISPPREFNWTPPSVDCPLHFPPEPSPLSGRGIFDSGPLKSIFDFDPHAPRRPILTQAARSTELVELSSLVRPPEPIFDSGPRVLAT
jgi:hypothetical protein